METVGACVPAVRAEGGRVFLMDECQEPSCFDGCCRLEHSAEKESFPVGAIDELLHQHVVAFVEGNERRCHFAEPVQCGCFCSHSFDVCQPRVTDTELCVRLLADEVTYADDTRGYAIGQFRHSWSRIIGQEVAST